MTSAPLDRSRTSALSASGLLAGAVAVVAGADVGTASAFDGSPLGSVHAAVWVVLVPALIALAGSLRRPVLGGAVAAGVGVAAVGRLLSDISLLTDPDVAVRPELFYELSARAQPFTRAAGAWVMVAGDGLMVLAGVIAARGVADRLAPGAAPIFPPPSIAPDTPAEHGPQLLAQAWEAETAAPATDISDPVATGPWAFAGSPVGTGASRAEDTGSVARNNGVIVAGFVGVLLLLGGSLGLPYSGGYLAARYLPAELGVAGIGGALAVAAAATVAVLVAAALPRRLAAALLGGIALTAAVPLLIAVAVRLAGAPVQLTPSVPVGLVGAGVLAAAGLLGNSTLLVDDEVPSNATLRRTGWTGAGLSLLTAVAAVVAWRLPQLRYNGGADPVLPGGYASSAPLAAPFLVAASVPLLAAVLWLVPALAAAGRAMATIGWLPLVFAGSQTLYSLGQLVASASVPNAGFAAPRWTAGPGWWWAVGGTVAGVAAAAVSLRSGRQARDASTLLVQEESSDRSRSVGGPLAAVLSVAAVIASALPVYRTTGGSSGTLALGFDVRSWGVLGLAAGMVAAALAGCRSLRPVGAGGLLLAGAAMPVARLVLPASVRAADGFALGAGWYAGWVAVVMFVVAAVLMALVTRRIVLVEPGGLQTGRPRAGAGLAAGKAPVRPAGGRPSAPPTGKRPVGRRPVGKSTSARASSSRRKST